MTKNLPIDNNPLASAAGDTSYHRTAARFKKTKVAADYPSQFRSTLRDRGEKRCILNALARVPAGSSLLDIPCGTGRLTPLLAAQGYCVTGADVSERMIQEACTNWDGVRKEFPKRLRNVSFEVRDVMQTGYDDRQFDAVLSHRLFHHFCESQTRVAALKELRRIAKHIVLVSYFDSFALDALRKRLTNKMRGIVPDDRIPIPASVFQRDLKEAGLTVECTIAKQWGISPFKYVVARPDATFAPAESTRKVA